MGRDHRSFFTGPGVVRQWIRHDLRTVSLSWRPFLTGQHGEDRAVPLDGPCDDSSSGLGMSAWQSFCGMAVLLQDALWWKGDLSWPVSSTSPLSPDPLPFPSVLPVQACSHNFCPKVSQAGIRGQCLCSAHTPGGCSHIKNSVTTLHSILAAPSRALKTGRSSPLHWGGREWAVSAAPTSLGSTASLRPL